MPATSVDGTQFIDGHIPHFYCGFRALRDLRRLGAGVYLEPEDHGVSRSEGDRYRDSFPKRSNEWRCA
jgi:hypothetical protein